MDNSQQYTLSRVSTEVSLKDRYYRGAKPQSDVFFPKVVLPTYFLDYEDRYYYASNYSSFGILGSVVSFDLPQGESRKRLKFYVPDGASEFKLGDVYKTKVKPLTSLQTIVFYTLNALRYFLSPFVEIYKFVARLLDLQALVVLALLIICGLFVHNEIGNVPYVDYTLYTLMGIEVSLAILNKSHWIDAIYQFRYYLERRSIVFYERALSLGEALNGNPMSSGMATGGLTTSYEKVSLLSIVSLEYDLFRWLQLKDDTRTLTRREIAELFSDLEIGLEKLDLPNWGIIERLLERHVHGKDAFIIPEVVTSWGIDREKEPELFFSCVANLRFLAGYKDFKSKITHSEGK
jgi:hypothetical protein